MIMKLCYTHTPDKNEQTEQAMYYNKMHEDDEQIVPTFTPKRLDLLTAAL